MSSLTDIRANVIAIVADDAGKLVNPTDYDRAITAALLRYTKDKPFRVIEDIAGDGLGQFNLPSSWSPEFSSVVSVEYPIGDRPPTLMDPEEYLVLDRAAMIQLVSDFTASYAIRVTITAIRTGDDVPDIDVAALENLAAAHALEQLANAYAQTGDSTINADAVNYRSKPSEFAARAKRYAQYYKDQMGIKEDDTVMAASAVTDMSENYPGGGDRLTHPRWARRKR
jgi:hypothetical protein